MTISRRQCLQWMGAAGSAALLSRCAALDRLFMGESSDLTQGVVIIGGGLAGLSAAYFLKQKNIPFVIFEQSSRLGGQIHTLNGHFGPGTWADLGPEWYGVNDVELRAMGQQLKAPAITFAGAQILSKPNNKSLLPKNELRKLQNTAMRQMQLSSLQVSRGADAYYLSPEALARDSSKPLTEWVMEISKDSAWMEWVKNWSWYQYGYQADFVPAGAFIKEFIFMGPESPWRQAEMSFRGGMGQLIDLLSAEVLGAFPEEKLRLGHRWVGAESAGGDNWDLIFMTPEGRRRYEVKTVVLTQAPQVLQNIDGLAEKVQSPRALVTEVLNKKWIRPYTAAGSTPQTSTKWLGPRPSWARQYTQVGAWGKVRHQKVLEAGVTLSQVEMASSPEQLVWDWSQQQPLIGGRSIGPVTALQAYRLQLPEKWYHTRFTPLDRAWLKPMEQAVSSAKKISELILANRTS